MISFSYQDKSNLLKSNPVFVVTHFQYCIGVFFKEIVTDGPLAIIKYYAIPVEFPICDSRHIYSFLWIDNAPTLTIDNKEEYIAFVDTVIHAVLPHETEQSELYKLVTTYQLHRLPKTCRKDKNQSCKFQFGRFFSNRTIATEPLPSNMPENVNLIILENRKQVLCQVTDDINSYLNPAKVNFCDSFQDNFVVIKWISEILNELGIDELEDKRALEISDEISFKTPYQLRLC